MVNVMAGERSPAWVLTVTTVVVLVAGFSAGVDAQTKPADAAGTNALPTYPIADWTAVPDTPTATTVTVTSVGSCTCDLTEGSCDGNCCCDPDCTVSATSSLLPQRHTHHTARPSECITHITSCFYIKSRKSCAAAKAARRQKLRGKKNRAPPCALNCSRLSSPPC